MDAVNEDEETVGLIKKGPGNTASDGVCEDKKQPGVMYYLRQGNILRNLVSITVIWVTCAFNYYMLSFQVKYMPGSFFVNTLALGVVDLPGPIFVIVLFSYFGKRSVFIGLFILQSLAGFSIILFVDEANPSWTMPALVGVAKFGITAAFTGVWIAHPSMFPTLFAVTSIGISNIASRFFVIFAPLVGEWKFPVPIYLFTMMTILSTIASYMLCEKSL